MESFGILEAAQRLENPRVPYVALDEKSMLTHVTRSRQLLTNPNHAARLGSFPATREYQCDSPSIFALLPVLQGSRDSPENGTPALFTPFDKLVHIRGRSVLPVLIKLIKKLAFFETHFYSQKFGRERRYVPYLHRVIGSKIRSLTIFNIVPYRK